MSRPIVAIVGRPNVGKSTLVNRIAQTSDAIVHQSRGVTRDRSYHVADWNGREFMLVDTGGIEPMKSDDVFATSIRDQALAAAEEAAVILFVVDGSVGVTEEDESGFLGGGQGLVADGRGEDIVALHGLDAARVHEHELATVPVGDMVAAVARDAAALVNDGIGRLRDAIDERRLAHVRAPDDRDNRTRHRFSLDSHSW